MKERITSALGRYFTNICVAIAVVTVFSVVIGHVEQIIFSMINAWGSSPNLQAQTSELLSAIVIGTIYSFFFSPMISKKLSYRLRVVNFGIVLYALLLLSLFGSSIGRLGLPELLFATLLYFLFIGAFLTGFTLYYRATGKKYDERLAEYHARHNTQTK